MAIKNYTTKTASLRATIADVNKLDAKKIKVNGKDVVLGAKHSNDTREIVTENDLWGQYTEIKDGQVIVHDDWATNPNESSAWNSSITKVEDNKAYIDNSFFANIQTEKINNGNRMFYQCSKLPSFSSDLPNLTDGGFMFYGCTKLPSFSSDLPNLTDGSYMFYFCTKLTIFSSDLPSLTNSSSMFYFCTKLTAFSSDLPSLTNGSNMFSMCTNLTSFSSDLSNLTYGDKMFNKCKLNTESVMYIADSIKDIVAEKQLYTNGTIPYVTLSDDVYSAPKGFMSDGSYVYTYKNPQSYTTTISASNVGKLTLGINVSNNADTIQQQLEDFAQEATFDTWEDLKTHFSNKGWTVTFQYGGTTEEIPNEFPNTYDLRGGEQIIPCQIFAKLVEADEDSAEYTNEDGTKFYNINWGHDVTHPQEFQQFNSLEDAMVNYGVILKQSIN